MRRVLVWGVAWRAGLEFNCVVRSGMGSEMLLQELGGSGMEDSSLISAGQL